MWHYPLFLLMNPRNFTGETPWWMYLVQVASCSPAPRSRTASWRTPCAGAIGAFVKGVRSKKSIRPHGSSTTSFRPSGSAVTIVAVIGLIVVPPISAIGAATC
ncbi:MAG: hypothetical protein ACLSVD_16265 [Eggerthellaceae bacterium]